MKKSEKIHWVLAGALALAGAALWLVPGAKFSACLSLGSAAALALWAVLGRWARESRAGRLVRRLYAVCLVCGFLVFTAAEALVVSYGEGDRSALPADAVIVLGAGVNGETPSLALSTRIEAAAAYLAEHPDIPVVLSGGQGPGEAITEAEAMRRALTGKGVEEKRLLLEERSTSTAENFAFSKALLEERGVDTETALVAVVSNDFHLYRAGVIAQRQGLTVVGVGAPLPWWWQEANYYVREAFALVNTVLFQL